MKGSLPGDTLVERGLLDLRRGEISVEALLVLIGAPRLKQLGVEVPAVSIEDPELQLYSRLAESNGDGAHSRYNSLLRTLVSFERAMAQSSR